MFNWKEEYKWHRKRGFNSPKDPNLIRGNYVFNVPGQLLLSSGPSKLKICLSSPGHSRQKNMFSKIFSCLYAIHYKILISKVDYVFQTLILTDT
jgi:hypothetical protein